MQKVIQRTIFAEKQAARRLSKKKDKAANAWQNSRRIEHERRLKTATSNLAAARQARVEDRELGPLAPRRDVGDNMNSYGTVDQEYLRLGKMTLKERAEQLKNLGGRYLSITKGDRVVLLEGRDKGKIGKVTEIDATRGMCKVEGMNMVSKLFESSRASLC